MNRRDLFKSITLLPALVTARVAENGDLVPTASGPGPVLLARVPVHMSQHRRDEIVEALDAIVRGEISAAVFDDEIQLFQVHPTPGSGDAA